LAASIVQHPFTNCRLYYSQVAVDPQKSIDYVQRNRNKKVIYRSFVTDSYTNITSGSSFNSLVNRGIVHPTAVLICPFIAAVSGSGLVIVNISHLLIHVPPVPPRDGLSRPVREVTHRTKKLDKLDNRLSTNSALSLTNLQVGVGGQNILNST
jgi:hypothetical protein